MSLITPSISPRARVFRLFAPASGTKKFLGLSLAPLALLLCCFLAFVITAEPSKTEMSNTEAFLLIFGIFLLPLVAVLLGIAAWRVPRHPPRALLWLAAALFIFSGGFLVSFLMFLDPELEKTVSVIFLLLIIVPLAMLFSMPAIYSIAKTVPEIRATLKSAADERALGYISTRGAVSLRELSELLDIPVSEIDNLVDGLLRSGALAGMMDMNSGLVFTAAYLAEKQRQLLEWVNLRGNIRIDELAQLLKASNSMVIDWLYQLIQRGQFGGYINWGKGLVYAPTGRKIGADSQCPQCGGTLAPGGGQRIVCLHCGTEMWERT